MAAISRFLLLFVVFKGRCHNISSSGPLDFTANTFDSALCGVCSVCTVFCTVVVRVFLVFFKMYSQSQVLEFWV